MRYIRFLILVVIIILSIFGWRFTPVYKSVMDIQQKKYYILQNNLKSHVIMLSEKIGDRSVFNYKNLIKAEEYIIEKFKSYGYNLRLQEYTVAGKKVRNIIALKEGDINPEEIIVFGAHYDTCFNPGADDNASGIAGMLEVARLLSKSNTNRTIKFIAFTNEEPPFFKTEKMGSFVYTRKAAEKGKNIKAAIILEMIGYYDNSLFSQRYPPLLGFFYPNRGNFILFVGNITFRSLAKKAGRIFREKSNFPLEIFIGPGFIPGVDFSDHWSFWKKDYPAIMVTDTAFYRNPNYHSETDTWQTLDYKSMSEVVLGLKWVLLELAGEII